MMEDAKRGRREMEEGRERGREGEMRDGGRGRGREGERERGRMENAKGGRSERGGREEQGRTMTF